MVLVPFPPPFFPLAQQTFEECKVCSDFQSGLPPQVMMVELLSVGLTMAFPCVSHGTFESFYLGTMLRLTRRFTSMHHNSNYRVGFLFQSSSLTSSGQKFDPSSLVALSHFDGACLFWR